ncbi:unnamed protein product [Acanthoscelides obtectus]|uniref:non-specific serine/threonine protein kinase n=1 Tax=Acanthoscelides obtectus TaxID=200917 RepID=A0A9P0K5Y9_ACAOB|nr:unnamed protein product [Acanthoscelides obtectus]CAK1648032.1 Serine/threonine-protein kinase pelle [Acanthoscelides obtectus]
MFCETFFSVYILWCICIYIYIFLFCGLQVHFLKMYIYLLPYEERQELCNILDQNDKWEHLGGAQMKYSICELDSLKRKVACGGKSPSDELLTMWSHQNHTLLELFILLSNMKCYQAMVAIKQYVDKQYHYLIKDGNKLDALKGRKENNVLESQIHQNNFDDNADKVLNKCLVNDLTTSCNESRVENLSAPKSPLFYGRHRMTIASDRSAVMERASVIPCIPYDELQKSTNNWDENVVLGKGGFGKVFKGTWKCTQVAIKRLEQRLSKPDSDMEQMRQSFTELHCLNSYRHDNVLPLYGYSIGGPHPCLIYQYMAGGSLDQRLRTNDPSRVLSWPTRLNIAVGSARGLQFLHTNMINGKPLVHGDIKSANILLDPNDQPRIGDFGLARAGPEVQYTYIKVSRIQGTRPYLPDEFLRGKKFSTKVDTYSFGIVLFEIVTALPPMFGNRKTLKDHVTTYEGDAIELKDSRVTGYDECFTEILNIGKLCVMKLPRQRPEMRDVLITLEKVSLHP